MNRAAAYRGQPLLVLAMVLAGWFALRVILWQAPFGIPLATAAGVAARLGAPMAHREQEPIPPLTPPLRTVSEPLAPAHGAVRSSSRWALASPSPFAPVSSRLASGQVLLLAAAFSQIEVPPTLAALMLTARATPAAIPPFPQVATDGGRWSGDGWLLLRKDTATAVTSGRGSYGRSQAGAVLRYRLAPSSGHHPTAYVRVSSAIEGPREIEAALGLSARPLPSVPIVLAAEVRGARFAGDTEARPAAFAYSEFPPLKLPFGVRGEAYFQGGYVGGRYATAFIDGQVRVDREVGRLGPAEVRAGGGAWGGAQKGVERLDVGPGASIALDVAGAPVRASADWRFRVAGEAEPGSGPALTVSAGF